MKDPNIGEDVRLLIKDILNKSNFRSKPSTKSENTLVVWGDLVLSLIKEPKILASIDLGELNIWSREYESKVYTFIQSTVNHTPRYHSFGYFHHSKRFTSQELIQNTGVTQEIDLNHEELYPWKFLFNFKNYDDYYYTKWSSPRFMDTE